MEFKSGMWVQNPKQPAWGIGQVLRYDENKVRVLFSRGGEKLLDLRFIALVEVEAPANTALARPRLCARTVVDMDELRQLCHLFHEQFKGRRSNTDDGRMATKVLEEMESQGDLTKATASQLFSWCHTGASYAEGVDLAQRICRLVYGRVPTAAEIEAAGL